MATRQIVYLRNGPQVPASQTTLEVASARAARTGRVKSVHVFCRALAGTVTVDVQKNAVSILTAVVTPTAGDQVAGTVDQDKAGLAVGDEIQVKVTTAAASTLDDLGVTIDLG